MEEIKLKEYKIFILERVIDELQKYKQDNKKKHEAGGILLGQIEGKNIYVMKISTPNNFDKSSRYSFERNKDIAQIIIDYEFANSNGKTIYIGEWHTHPENIPTPSSVDVNMLKDQIRLGKLNEPFALLLIQGIKGMYVGIYKKGELIDEKRF